MLCYAVGNLKRNLFSADLRTHKPMPNDNLLFTSKWQTNKYEMHNAHLIKV